MTNAGLMSYGVIKAEGSQQQAIARGMRDGERVDSGARRVRRFLSNTTLKLEAFLGAWTAWVVSHLGKQAITLLVDETKLHDKLGVMLVGLAWEKRCLPLAWRVYRVNDQAHYPGEGQVGVIGARLAAVKAGLPADCRVLVLADRGIGCSPALCQAVRALDFHFLFRVTCQTKLVNRRGEYTIAAQVQPGCIWQAEGEVFKKRGRIPARAHAL